MIYMNKFLDDFLITMPTTQRKKLMELLDLRRKEGVLKSNHELEAELERLLAEIDKRDGGPTFQARAQKGIVDSKSYNKNMEEISFDLATLFEASATIDRLISDNKYLARSLLSGIKKKIYNLQSKVEKYKLLMKNTNGFIDSVYEYFKSPEYMENDETVLQTLRKDRLDQYYPATYNAENVGNALQLAGIETIDQLKTNYGRRLAKIEVLNRTGYPTQNPNHEIEKAVDGSLDTFWAESILVDQPITQNINDLWENKYEVFPKDGAICELKITLNGVTTVSDIHFDPFCDYPLEIISIYGYETEEMGGRVYELISPNHPNPHQQSQKSVNQMTFQFPSVDVSVLKIVIRQENYVKENFIVNKDEANNMTLWYKLSSSPDLIPDYKNSNETIAEFNKKNEITGWSVYLEKLKDWAERMQESGVIEAVKTAMETIRMGDYKNPLLLKLQSLSANKKKEIEENEGLSASWKAIDKISYLYGAYDISVFGRKYKNISIFLTDPLPLSSNATQISLETIEKHHDIEIGTEVNDIVTRRLESPDTARITDIEYYITHKKNPSAEDWQPILPIEKKYVLGELLLGDLYPGIYPEFEEYESRGDKLVVYSFRFPVVSNQTVTLRRNGIPMNPSTYLISDDGKKIAIKGKYFTASSIYTVDYKPVDSAWIVNLDESTGVIPTQYIDDNGETGEFFSEADMNRTIQLKHKPYLFRSKLFHYNEEEHVHEQNQDALHSIDPHFPVIVRVDGEEYRNITNYTTNTYNSDHMEENTGKVFAQIGSTIIFGKPKDGKVLKNINVDYYYVATNIRMKAILRRNSAEDESVTPALYSYHIRCQSYDQEI